MTLRTAVFAEYEELHGVLMAWGNVPAVARDMQNLCACSLHDARMQEPLRFAGLSPQNPDMAYNTIWMLGS